MILTIPRSFFFLRTRDQLVQESTRYTAPHASYFRINRSRHGRKEAALTADFVCATRLANRRQLHSARTSRWQTSVVRVPYASVRCEERPFWRLGKHPTTTHHRLATALLPLSAFPYKLRAAAVSLVPARQPLLLQRSPTRGTEYDESSVHVQNASRSVTLCVLVRALKRSSYCRGKHRWKKRRRRSAREKERERETTPK